MGGPSSPSVFQTTPPQPALKARSTLYALSVGGAEASQNGLGDLMPTKVLRRSAMACLVSVADERDAEVDQQVRVVVIEEVDAPDYRVVLARNRGFGYRHDPAEGSGAAADAVERVAASHDGPLGAPEHQAPTVAAAPRPATM